MSIVLDALKRAEREHHVSISNAPFEQRRLSETKTFYKKTIAGIAFLNLVAIIAACLIFQDRKPLPVPASASPMPSASSGPPLPMPQKSVLQDPVPAPEAREIKKTRNYLSIQGGPEIRIDGVFIDKKGSFVLYGDQMLSVGEDLDGTTIAAITLNKVTVDYKGQRYEILA